MINLRFVYFILFEEGGDMEEQASGQVSETEEGMDDEDEWVEEEEIPIAPEHAGKPTTAQPPVALFPPQPQLVKPSRQRAISKW